jgi:hypothetical protein
MRKLLTIFFLIVLFSCSHDTPSAVDNNDNSNSNTGVLHTYKVLPRDTDSDMDETNKPHYAFVDSGITLKGKLVVFMGGTNSAPNQYQAFPEVAASLGYHVIDLNYLNTVTTLDCKDADDVDCFTKYHEEIIFGNDVSALVDVNASNSIVNRILKLLQYLHQQHPQDGWEQFFTNNTLNYEKFVMAGHSQGGGHAAYIAYKFEVDRLIMFCSPADYSEKYSSPATWCTETFATPADRFYGLMHRRDDTVPPEDTHAIWQSMQLLTDSDTISADGIAYKNTRALSTNLRADTASTSHSTHDVPVMDKAKPAPGDYAHLKDVWNYLLGN